MSSLLRRLEPLWTFSLPANERGNTQRPLRARRGRRRGHAMRQAQRKATAPDVSGSTGSRLCRAIFARFRDWAAEEAIIRARSSRQPSRMWSRTGSRRPTCARTCSSAGVGSWATGPSIWPPSVETRRPRRTAERRILERRALPLPGTISGSDHDRAFGPAGASPPAPAQRRGERPVVPGQACHLPGELLDLPPQGFALFGLPLDPLLQGFDLLAVPPLLHLVLRGQPLQGHRQLPF